KLADELNKDTAKGRSIDDIFKVLVSDKDGNQIPNILVDPGQQAAEGSKVVFTTRQTQTPPPGTKLGLADIMKLKNQNPDLDVSQYMQNQ
ncbi:MAG: hypothetical protein ACRC36_28020, partial [Lacrimispora sphenoides]